MKNAVFWDVVLCGSSNKEQGLHGITFQKTAFYLITAMNTQILHIDISDSH
jgi:hypothetical protein